MVSAAVEPLTAAIAGAAGASLIKAGMGGAIDAIRQRWLEPREAKRVSDVVQIAAAKIEENLRQGKQRRNDNFFERDLSEDGTPMEEVAEGVLHAAQRTHESRKVKFLGTLLGNLPFHQEIDRSTANMLVTLGEQLTYRQLLLIALAPKGRGL